jgi:hypothetical protein
MRRLLLAALFALALPAHAQTIAQTWGFEAWTCGNAVFPIRVGNGRNILLKSISGTFTGSPAPGATDAAPGVVRQSLTAIVATGLMYQADGAILATPVSTNHSLDMHLANVNVKQSGLGTTPPQALHVAFDPPLIVPGGTLAAYMTTQNYGGAASCLDTEAQLSVVYE